MSALRSLLVLILCVALLPWGAWLRAQAAQEGPPVAALAAPGSPAALAAPLYAAAVASPVDAAAVAAPALIATVAEARPDAAARPCRIAILPGAACGHAFPLPAEVTLVAPRPAPRAAAPFAAAPPPREAERTGPERPPRPA